MSEFSDGNHIVKAAERQRLYQPQESTLRHLGSTIFRGCETIVDAGVSLVIQGTNFVPHIRHRP